MPEEKSLSKTEEISKRLEVIYENAYQIIKLTPNEKDALDVVKGLEEVKEAVRNSVRKK